MSNPEKDAARDRTEQPPLPPARRLPLAAGCFGNSCAAPALSTRRTVLPSIEEFEKRFARPGALPARRADGAGKASA